MKMYELVMQETIPSTNISYTTLFLIYDGEKWWNEFTEPGKNHDFHPLRLSKNVISPDAEVLEC